VTFSATANDAVDGNSDVVTFKEGNNSVASGDTFAIGTHTITATTTDANHNTSTKDFTFTVQDTTAPDITFTAPSTAEATSAAGAAVTFSATASDAVDGSSDIVTFKEGTNSVASGNIFAIGTHTVTATTTDANHNTSTKDFTFTVQDTTAPTLTITAPDKAEATGAAGAAVTFSATASDAVDGNSDVVTFKEGNNSVASGDTFSIGTHTVTATTTDANHNTSTKDFTFTVQDTTAPTIAVNAPDKAEATSAAGAAVTFSATTNDAVDGSNDVVTFKEGNNAVASGDTFSIGTHTVTATTTDNNHNTSTRDFTFTVQDTTAPTINVTAPSTAEATSAAGATVVFSATTSDAVDGNSDVVTFKEGNNVVTSGNLFSIGTHTITATTTDAAHNTSTQNFTFTVQDTTAPTITVTSPDKIEATSAAGAVVTFSATASDAVDGSSDIVTFKEGTNAVVSGATFAVGTHTVTATTTDAAHNTSTKDFTFTVQDTTAPTVAINSTLGTNTGLTPTITDGGLTRDNTVTVSGTVSDTVGVASVHVFDGTNDLGAATISGNTWSFTTTALTDGLHSFSAKATDTSGNGSASGSIAAMIDATAPAAPGVALAIDSGSSNTDHITNVGTLAITSEAGSTLSYSTDNGSHWTAAFTASEGANTVLVRQTDVAGNTSATSSLSFTLDTKAPAAPTLALTSDTGVSATDGITNIGTLNVGNVEAGATVTYSVNGGASWSSSFTAVEGQNTVLARQTDVAGNTGATTSLNFTLDTQAVAPAFTSLKPNGNGTVSLAGTTEAGAAVTVSDNTTGKVVGTVTADSTGAWSLTSAAISSVHAFGVSVKDVAGNVAAPSIQAFAGTKANDSFVDVAGQNDYFAGAQGNDTFAFAAGFGKDVIVDFTAGNGNHDILQFSKQEFANYSAVMSHASQSGANVVIDDGHANVLTLIGVSLGDLKAVDFTFV